MALLCNAVDADMYVCVPFLATDAYVDSLANLLKNMLEPERKIYVEYSNELWNGAADYDMHRNHDSAVAEVGRGGSPLAFDGSHEWDGRGAGPANAAWRSARSSARVRRRRDDDACAATAHDPAERRPGHTLGNTAHAA